MDGSVEMSDLYRVKVMMSNRTAITLALLFGLLGISGCGSGIHSNFITPSSASPPLATQGGLVTVSPTYTALGFGQSSQFIATVSGGGSVQWLVNGIAGGNASVGTVDSTGKYSAPTTAGVSTNVVVSAVLVSSSQTNYATAVVSLVLSGVVTGTANPQVASYTINLPSPGSVYVEFGESVSYGLPTSKQTTASTQSGGPVTVLVAGMLGSSTYHMRAQVVLNDGAVFTDSDHTFATGVRPPSAAVAVTSVAGGAPQPGIAMFDTLRPHEVAQAFATDLSGNVIWTYNDTDGSVEDLVQPIKLLPNGHFLVQISYASSIPVQKGGVVIPGTLNEVREVDLAGTTIRSVTEAQVASALVTQGYKLQLGSLHHDVLVLPNGHLLLLCTVTESVAVSGTSGMTTVLGDALIDLDQNFNPDWVWNSFDHLDVNRHPYLFPDWTHSNALLYSVDDHNILLSVRHQNWIIKIDFQDGKGSGNVLWRLGEGGDFRLLGGIDPTDWFYAQHGPSYFSTNTVGVFTLGVMDNGDDRQFPTGVLCGVGGAAPCLYSTASVLQVDEGARTATLVEHYVPPASMYSFFGGNVDLLGNGDREVNFCAVTTGSVVQELRGPNGSEQVVWQAVTGGSNQYRVERLPSLYPGVQW